MTTIAADGTRVACDSAVSIGNRRAENFRQKIKFKDGYLFGCSGNMCVMDPLIEWWLAGAKKQDFPGGAKDIEFVFGVFFRDVAIMYDQDSHFADMHAYPTAMGSGTNYALGAMKSGEDAVRAVQIACQLDVYSWAPVQHHDIPDMKSTDPRPPFVGKNKKHDPKLKPKMRKRKVKKNGPNTAARGNARTVAKHGNNANRNRKPGRVLANSRRRAAPIVGRKGNTKR
jgi:hypothetical protein